ncbi:hypothetical protein L1987_33124 [Smallanthus sonchifolius]|uniref:Uncharacterized protein n=1 Tax=Smallanthus sonchifolius TaxID=185202 RepID=A0ACB9HRI2_9ASTR|nr:hypothetical protein L1987_33124 [Smallanthus sonchifolius]
MDIHTALPPVTNASYGTMFSRKGKGKEKEGAASKSRKKSRRQVVDSDEEMEAPRIPKPWWTRPWILRISELWVCQCFERLGWGVTLTFRDPNQMDKVPTKAILQWMSTLVGQEGDNPPWTTTFMGYVGKKLDLFRPGAGGRFKRSDLNIMPKILQMIAQTNMLPRMGDRNQIRQYENALDKNTYYLPKPHKFLELAKLSKTLWTYKKTRMRVLLRERRTSYVLMGMVPNAPLLAPGEEEEFLDSTNDEDDEGHEG